VAVLSNMPPRKLRIFAFDPSLGRRHETVGINAIVVSIPWEMDPCDPRAPFRGPVGEYLEVVDYDPTLELFYAPIDLHDPKLLADNGLRPAEWNPQFHQQMVYAVAMNTIANFENALGRVALWADRGLRDRQGQWVGERYVQRLRIYPHALREANAYYSPKKKALLFGYFASGGSGSGVPPGTTVFTCLSHDIIAHETTHALLDGLHPRFNEPTNPDVLALHEAFSDIVAIFQHFSYPEVLRDQIARTRGDLESQSLLGELAQEFGRALGRGGALRNALGRVDKDGAWRPRLPDPNILKSQRGQHVRGSILVAAVFRAFLSIYRARIADLLRIASNGAGTLPQGELHPDLVNRLADEAAKSARHILQMCIRALDYCPPVDVSFGDYLRAIITADHDLYPEDEHNYRVAVIEAFLAWGIVPRGMPIVSVETLLWPTMRDAAADFRATAKSLSDLEGELGLMLSRPLQMLERIKQRKDLHDSEGRKFIKRLDEAAGEITDEMQRNMERRIGGGRTRTRRAPPRSQQKLMEFLSRNLLELGLDADRKVEWLARQLYRQLFWGLMTEPKMAAHLRIMGLSMARKAPATIVRSKVNNLPRVEVHSVRMAVRRGNRGQTEREYVVELTQQRSGYFDPKEQAAYDRRPVTTSSGRKRDFRFRRGCTLLIDAETFEIRRLIRTAGSIDGNSDNDAELDRMRAFLADRSLTPRNAFESGDTDVMASETFMHLHRHYE
jgi:hypothetical protein